jgi:hypothetical protein
MSFNGACLPFRLPFRALRKTSTLRARFGVWLSILDNLPNLGFTPEERRVLGHLTGRLLGLGA